MHTLTHCSLCSWYCQEFVPPPATPLNPKSNDVSPNLLASRILIVDDEHMNVALLQAILARAGYSNVVATSNSLEVAGLCAHEAPDLVLLDVMMPHRDGFGILEDLRASARTKSFAGAHAHRRCQPRNAFTRTQGGRQRFSHQAF